MRTRGEGGREGGRGHGRRRPAMSMSKPGYCSDPSALHTAAAHPASRKSVQGRGKWEGAETRVTDLQWT